MIDKDPLNYPLLTYARVIVLSTMGGLCHHIVNLKKKKYTFSLLALVGDLFIAGFTGVMTFYLCESSGIVGPLQALLVGISGHMGSRTIFIFENYINRWLADKFTSSARNSD